MVSDFSLFEKIFLAIFTISEHLLVKEEHDMIQKIMTFVCPRCGSDNLVKNGHNKVNSQQAHCKDCHAYFVLDPKTPHSEGTRETLLNAA